MKYRTILCLALAFSAVACDNDPVGEAPRAETKEVVAPATTSPKASTPAGAQTFAFSEQGSSFDFIGAKVTGKHDGKVKNFSGKIELVDGDPLKGKVTVTIDMKTIETDTPKLTGHLMSADFFDVEKFPESKFESTKVEKAADGFTITGNLTLHGVTKSISFPAKIVASADEVSVAADFGINRKDFEIVYPGMPDDLIKEEVLIKLNLKAKKS